MILSDFMSRHMHSDSNPHEIIPISFNIYNFLYETYYRIEMKDWYLVQTQSQMKVTKHLTNLGQMWLKYLLLATFASNTFNSLNLANYSLYELVFGRKPKILLNLETTQDIKVTGTFKEYYELLNKRLKYLHDILQSFKSKRIAMINKDREFFQYNSGDLMYIISPLTSQLQMASRKIMVKYIGPIVVYKIIDLHNYLLMTLDGRPLQVQVEHERLKPTILRTSEGNVNNLSKLKEIVNAGLALSS